MLIPLMIKSDDPKEVRDQVASFFTSANLSKDQLVSMTVSTSETSMVVLIVYDDGRV